MKDVMSSNPLKDTMSARGMNLLDKVERVDPPPFLLTRIEARLAARSGERPSRSWVAAMALSIMLVLVVNSVLVVRGVSNGNSEGAERIAASVGLQVDNHLYP